MTEIGINTVMQVFKDNLAMTIKNSQLPIGIIYYVFKDVYNDLEKIYNETLEKEKQDILSSMEEDKKEDKDKKKDK
mgnify:CR=1 FL=1